MLVYVLFHLGQLSHFPSCCGAGITNLNKPPSSFLLHPFIIIKWCCRENAAGALYKIIRREKLVNVSQNYGRIEMSSAGVWMELGRKQFEKMMADCSMHAVHDHLAPRVDLCTGRTTSVVVVDDRRWRRLSTSAVRRMFSARYAGANPLRQRCVRTQRWNVIRSGTHSQWSSQRSGVMRSECLTENTSRAAALRMTVDAGLHWAAVVDLADN